MLIQPDDASQIAKSATTLLVDPSEAASIVKCVLDRAMEVFFAVRNLQIRTRAHS